MSRSGGQGRPGSTHRWTKYLKQQLRVCCLGPPRVGGMPQPQARQCSGGCHDPSAQSCKGGHWPWHSLGKEGGRPGACQAVHTQKRQALGLMSPSSWTHGKALRLAPGDQRLHRNTPPNQALPGTHSASVPRGPCWSLQVPRSHTAQGLHSFSQACRPSLPCSRHRWTPSFPALSKAPWGSAASASSKGSSSWLARHPTRSPSTPTWLRPSDPSCCGESLFLCPAGFSDPTGK